MRIVRLLKISAVATLVAGLSVATLAQPAMAASSDLQVILNGQNGINSYRAAANVGTVNEVANLDTLAQARADQGARDGMIQHDPDYWNYNLPAGTVWGETLVNGYGLTPDGVATAWELSNAHRPIMEDGQYTQVGLGWSTAADGQEFAVAIFVPQVATSAARPGVVQDVLATKTGEREITANWAAPASSSPFTGYQVTLATIDNTVVDSRTVNTSTFNHVFSNVNRGKSYIVHVTASNAGVQGSDAQSNAVIDIPATVPSAPTQPVATKTGGRSLRLSWSAPTDNGGSSLSGYIVKLYKDGALYQTQNTTDSAAGFENLIDGAAYTASVSATNSLGTGTFSAASAVLNLPPVAAATTPGSVQDLRLVATNASQLIATWTATDNTAYYLVSLYRNGSIIATKQASTAATTFDIAANQTASYAFVVSAFNTVGAGAGSPLSNTVAVNVSVVQSTTPTPVQLQPQPTRAPDPVAAPVATVPPVAAEPVRVEPKPIVSAKPGKVATPALSGISKTSAKVSWTQPSANGNGNINRYLVQVYRYQGGKYVFWKQLSVKSTAKKPGLKLSGMKVHTRYSVKVQAFSTRGSTVSFNSIWHGAYSATKMFSTKG